MRHLDDRPTVLILEETHQSRLHIDSAAYAERKQVQEHADFPCDLFADQNLAKIQEHHHFQKSLSTQNQSSEDQLQSVIDKSS